MKHTVLLLICLFALSSTFTASGPPSSINNQANQLAVTGKKQSQRFYIDPWHLDKKKRTNTGITAAIAWMKHLRAECTVNKQNSSRMFSPEEIDGDHIYSLIVDFCNENN